MEYLAQLGHFSIHRVQVENYVVDLQISREYQCFHPYYNACNLVSQLRVVFSYVIVSAVPNCGDYVDCFGCASQEQCAWCASDNTCSTISDAFSNDCRGLVFEPPCPTDFVPGSSDSVIRLLCVCVCVC